MPPLDVYHDSFIMRHVLSLAGHSKQLPPPLPQNSPELCVSHSTSHAAHCINLLRSEGLWEQYTDLHLPTVEPVVEMILDGFFDHPTVRELPIDDLDKQELLRRVLVETAAAGVTLADDQIRRLLIEKVEHFRRQPRGASFRAYARAAGNGGSQ